MNSRGEFNRCHIPKLQIEEEEPEGAKETRKNARVQIQKVLREQDKNREDTRVKELRLTAH